MEDRIKKSLRELDYCQNDEEILEIIRKEAKKIAIHPEFGIVKKSCNPKDLGSLFCLKPEYLVLKMFEKGFGRNLLAELEEKKERIIRFCSGRLAITLFQRLHDPPSDLSAICHPNSYADLMAEMAIRSQYFLQAFEISADSKRGYFFNHELSEISFEAIGLKKKEISRLIKGHLLARVKMTAKGISKTKEREEKRLSERPDRSASFFLLKSKNCSLANS